MNKTVYKLQELGEYKNGANYPKGSYGSGDKIVNVKDLFRGRYVSYDGLDELKPGVLKNKDIYLVEDGDLLFTRSSLVKSGAGMVAMIKDPKEDVLFCGFIIRYRPDKSKVYPLYLLYLLRSPVYRKLFTDGSAQTNISNINQTTLGNIEVELPSLDEQQNIVNIIDLCDTKIELNQRINAELESMAKTLYDYWFVQFEYPLPSSPKFDGRSPVEFGGGAPIGAEGVGYKSAGGKMVWNEELKREIPLGWNVGTLADLGTITGGSTPPREVDEYFSDIGTAWITPKDLSLNTENKFITKGELDVSEKGIKAASLTIMPKGTILLSSRAPIGYMAIAREEVTTNQGFKSFIPDKGYSIPFIYYTVKNAIPTIINHSSGSTFKEASATVLKSISLCLPPVSITEKYEEAVEAIFERQNKLELESQTLTELRDWLLPMLMNGQVKVK